MIGNNSMQVNKATMIQALQEWLDKRSKFGVKVVEVDAAPNGMFTIRLSETAEVNPHDTH